MLDKDESGQAADTGSAVHAAIAAWHKNDKDSPAAMRSMRDGLNNYPFADLDAAGEMFLKYAQDPRNREAEIVLVEEKVEVEIAPSPKDPTGQAILINGTLDQVRLKDGILGVLDVKTGRPEGLDMLRSHALQLAAYMVGATRKLGLPVREAGVIRVRDYGPRSIKPVFWWSDITLPKAERLLAQVAHRVAELRAGVVTCNPGTHCHWCPARTPANCLEDLTNGTYRNPRGNA